MVSDFQRPRMRMMSPSTPPRSITIAPLARRERVEASLGLSPTVGPMRWMLSRMALVMLLLLSTFHLVLSW